MRRSKLRSNIVMRLYLSSFREGNLTSELQLMVPPGSKVGISVNALDNQTSEVRMSILHREISAMQRLGYHPEEVDLREYFHGRASMHKRLTQLDLVWCSGGNAFVLRLAMRLAKFDEEVQELLRAGKIAYGGYSAGAVVAGNSLRGIDLVDRIDDFPRDYPKTEIIYDGLALVPYTVVPHWRSNHPESPIIEKVVQYLEEEGLPFKALSDGDVDLGKI